MTATGSVDVKHPLDLDKPPIWLAPARRYCQR